MQARLWLKSHCELPDIEDSPVIIEDNRCQARFTDDADDTYGYRCGSQIKWQKNTSGWAKYEGRCSDCGASYLTDDKLNRR